MLHLKEIITQKNRKKQNHKMWFDIKHLNNSKPFSLPHMCKEKYAVEIKPQTSLKIWKHWQLNQIVISVL